MGPWTLLIPFLYHTLPVSNSTLTRQTVDVKGTVTLPCKGAISKNNSSNVTWMIDENILVAQYQQGELTTGDWFKDRVSISKVDFSLNISPVEYSDRGLYKCYRMGKRLDDIDLVVYVPTEVRARLGEPATLPCYVLVDINQKGNIDTVHWKKDGQTVLSFQSGLFNRSSECENRCNMSVDKVKFGDLSLNISEVRHSDRGTYQCFSTEKTEKSIKPDEIILTIEGTTWPRVLVVGVLVVGVLVVLVLVLVVLVRVRKKCFYCTQRQQDSQRNMVELANLQEASRVPGQPVEDNEEEEQLRTPICESGHTEDKHGPHPWHDDDS